MRPLITTSLIILALTLSIQHSLTACPKTKTYPGPTQLQRVIDGDTIVLNDDTRVRLIGVDTPETVHPTRPVEPYGPEATNFTKQFLRGKFLTLKFDGPKKDRYGRTLAHVYGDGKPLAQALLLMGLARAKLNYQYSDRMKRRFATAQKQAQLDGKGIWDNN
jgi:micrococcal nuclease